MKAVLMQIGEVNLESRYLRETTRLSEFMEKQEKKDKIKKYEIMKIEKRQMKKEIQLVEMVQQKPNKSKCIFRNFFHKYAEC